MLCHIFNEIKEKKRQKTAPRNRAPANASDSPIPKLGIQMGIPNAQPPHRWDTKPSKQHYCDRRNNVLSLFSKMFYCNIFYFFIASRFCIYHVMLHSHWKDYYEGKIRESRQKFFLHSLPLALHNHNSKTNQNNRGF